MSALRSLAQFLVVCLLICSAGGPAYGRDIINAPFDPINIDILSVTERIQSPGAEAEVEAAPDASGSASTMRLSALSPGPNHRWLVFSIRNSSPIPLEYVIVTQRKSFVGSGVIWPEFGSRMVVDAQASPGLPPTAEQIRTADAYSFRIESNQTITYALEVAGPWPDNLSLWQRGAFDKQRQQVSFFHGLLLGIATLVSIYVSSLFIIRRKIVFPAAALFSWCGTTFLAIEFGYLPVLVEVPVAVEYKIRALVEAVMAFSLFACLYSFVELRKRMPVAGYTMLLVIAALAALVGYAYTEPEIGAGLARVAILLGALAGLVIVVTLARSGVIRAQVALSSWLLISFWSVLAALAATGIVEHDLIGPGLAAGLVLVNLMIAFTVTQYAFDAGVISSRFFEDSGRRALALAGSEQCVWDWREDQGWLYVGAELEPTLGIKRGSLAAGGLKGWLELMHPGDRPAYVAAVEAAIQRGKGTFSQEFRLRRKDGTYRWYQLRARAIPGEQGRASRCIGTLADITTLKRSEERMLYDAVQDRLTGLPNRALFMDRLDRTMRRSQADGAVKLYVAVVDIDRFKNVNDGLGHSIGDSLLLTMARRLQEFIGPEDTLARLSGDQFGLIINAARPARKMHELTEHIRQSIARPIELNPREVFLTASIGVSEYLRDILAAADVLKDAEIALYEAKRRGKNKIEFFRPTMRDDRSKLIEIESDLRRALERNEIEVAYQPIYNLAVDKLAGFEALVRWRHKKHGVLGPDEFIGIAEETGIIVDLGRYVMGEAARQLGIWQRVLRPTEPIFVSVNLSSRQVLDQNLVDDVKTIMSREDVTRGTLKLELTETLVMENPELSAQVLSKLNDIGVAILCDDFGTGYSSLANLQRFSFDTLKIDKSFIGADPEDDGAMVILESIIILAHDLGMRVVAEGVENKDQLERLREFECDYAQGFHFGEPLTARAVVEALGGKPHMFEQKRARGPRGFLGKLMRAGVTVPDDQDAPVRSRLTSDVADPEKPLTPRPDPLATPPEETHAHTRPQPEADRDARDDDLLPPASGDVGSSEDTFSGRPERARAPVADLQPEPPKLEVPPVDEPIEASDGRRMPPVEDFDEQDSETAGPDDRRDEPAEPSERMSPTTRARERMTAGAEPAGRSDDEDVAQPAHDRRGDVVESASKPAEPASVEEGVETQPVSEQEVETVAEPEPEPGPEPETEQEPEEPVAKTPEFAPEMAGNEITATANALAAARLGAGSKQPEKPPAPEPAKPAPAPPVAEKPAAPPATGRTEEAGADEPDGADLGAEDEGLADDDPARQLEALASKRKRPSKLAKLLRRSKKSPTAAEP